MEALCNVSFVPRFESPSLSLFASVCTLCDGNGADRWFGVAAHHFTGVAGDPASPPPPPVPARDPGPNQIRDVDIYIHLLNLSLRETRAEWTRQKDKQMNTRGRGQTKENGGRTLWCRFPNIPEPDPSPLLVLVLSSVLRVAAAVTPIIRLISSQLTHPGGGPVLNCTPDGERTVL